MCAPFSSLLISLSLSYFSSHVGTELIYLPWQEPGSNQLSWSLLKSFVSWLIDGISPSGKVLTTSMTWKENIYQLKISKDIYY
jgi:hypothetical protein